MITDIEAGHERPALCWLDSIGSELSDSCIESSTCGVSPGYHSRCSNRRSIDEPQIGRANNEDIRGGLCEWSLGWGTMYW